MFFEADYNIILVSKQFTFSAFLDKRSNIAAGFEIRGKYFFRFMMMILMKTKCGEELISIIS